MVALKKAIIKEAKESVKRDCLQYPLCLMDQDWRPSHCKNCEQYQPDPKMEVKKVDDCKHMKGDDDKHMDSWDYCSEFNRNRTEINCTNACPLYKPKEQQ